MSMKFTAPYKGENRTVTMPDECPVCHHSIVLTNHLALVENPKYLQVVYLCPNLKCKSLFVCYYGFESAHTLKIKAYEPYRVNHPKISDSIKNISPEFLKIFNEAYEALNRNFKQIAGPGFRKAFEFLIKDYSKSLNEESEHESINKMFSGDVVKKYISHPKIKKMAERALWLGNDETHYLRIWQDKDINDLINLINLTNHWIEIEEMTNDYEEDMQKK